MNVFVREREREKGEKKRLEKQGLCEHWFSAYFWKSTANI